MKIYPLCYRELELSYFPKTKGKLYTYCIDYKGTIQRDWIRKKEEKKNLKININIQKNSFMPRQYFQYFCILIPFIKTDFM